MSYLSQTDPEIARAIHLETRRQSEKLELIASENFVSEAVLEAQGSVLTNKYAEGYPGRRYYGGCEFVDIAENLARDRARLLFGAEHANVQPHSGTQANMQVLFSVLQPGDTILASTSPTAAISRTATRKFFRPLLQDLVLRCGTGDRNYRLRPPPCGREEHRPKLIIAGASAYPRTLISRAFAG